MQILIYPAAEAVPTLGLVTFGAEGISGVIADSARYRSTESLPPFFTARVSVDRMLLEGNIQVQVKILSLLCSILPPLSWRCQLADTENALKLFPQLSVA